VEQLLLADEARPGKPRRLEGDGARQRKQRVTCGQRLGIGDIA
jgi:hypothetical protein